MPHYRSARQTLDRHRRRGRRRCRRRGCRRGLSHSAPPSHTSLCGRPTAKKFKSAAAAAAGLTVRHRAFVDERRWLSGDVASPKTAIRRNSNVVDGRVGVGSGKEVVGRRWALVRCRRSSITRPDAARLWSRSDARRRARLRPKRHGGSRPVGVPRRLNLEGLRRRRERLCTKYRSTEWSNQKDLSLIHI